MPNFFKRYLSEAKRTGFSCFISSAITSVVFSYYFGIYSVFVFLFVFLVLMVNSFAFNVFSIYCRRKSFLVIGYLILSGANWSIFIGLSSNQNVINTKIFIFLVFLLPFSYMLFPYIFRRLNSFGNRP